MRVVIIGPGRVGCGYLTPLFRSAACDVVLAVRDEATAERIRRSSHYSVRITAPPATVRSGTGTRTEATRILVKTPEAVVVETPEFVDAVAGADLVCTSVGVGNVRSLAPPLARALAARGARRPIDVWTVENGDCASQLEADVREAARGGGLTLPPVGFAGAVATVAVPHGSWRTRKHCPEFVGDAFRSLVLDERRLVTEVPSLPGLSGSSDYLARLHEKLYVFNAGHAICAYLGWLGRHATIADAASNPFLRPLVARSVLEARRALLATHPSLGSNLHAAAAEALARFGDCELADPIVRVAREPIRKLAPRERLLGPAELIRWRTGRVPEPFALAVAGALLYRNEEDEQSCRLAAELARAGVTAVLESVCGLAPGHPFAQAVASRYWALVMPASGEVFRPARARSEPRAFHPALVSAFASR